MSRHPWRTRAGLLAIVNALAGVGLALGFTADSIDPVMAAAIAVVAILADLGILRDGESETTPVSDPVDRTGVPLVPYTAGPQASPGPSDEVIARLFQANGADLHERGAD